MRLRPTSASIKSFLLYALVASIFSCSASNEEKILGQWQSNTVQWRLTGGSNAPGTYEVIQFFKDGSLKLTRVIKAKTGSDLILPVGGTYKIIDTNHITLELAFNSLPQAPKVPYKCTYKISGNKLELFQVDEMGHELLMTYLRVKE